MFGFANIVRLVFLRFNLHPVFPIPRSPFRMPKVTSHSNKRQKLSEGGDASSDNRRTAQVPIATSSSPEPPTKHQRINKGKNKATAEEDNSRSQPTSALSRNASSSKSRGRQNRRKLAPARPYPAVKQTSNLAVPRSARQEGNNMITISRKTPLGAHLRRAVRCVVDFGSVIPAPPPPHVLLIQPLQLDTRRCIYTPWARPSRSC